MNWHKLKNQCPLACEELKELHNKTGLEGVFLIDKYIEINGKKRPLFWLPLLKEIDKELDVKVKTTY